MIEGLTIFNMPVNYFFEAGQIMQLAGLWLGTRQAFRDRGFIG
jgi:hypothetical protein